MNLDIFIYMLSFLIIGYILIYFTCRNEDLENKKINKKDIRN